MGNDGVIHLQTPYYCTIKVHSLLCLELKKIIDRISQIFSAIESARPRSTTGLQALCSLHVAMDKARLLIRHCTESSKLYLAFKADRILWRCKNIRNALDLYLSQIQNMVPTFLAAKISGIVEDLRAARFHLESSEDEAGMAVKELVKQDIPASDSINESELKAFGFAAVRLKITSPLAVLIEKRSIKKLNDKVLDMDPKKKILQYLYYLLRKYGGVIGTYQAEGGLLHEHEEHRSQTDDSATRDPPQEFKCPISTRLMYDPVIIASGKTYERVWIEKWLDEGNDACPITHVKLDNLLLTPNIAMKGLISSWCSNHGITVSEPCVQSLSPPDFSQKNLSLASIASIGSSMYDLRLQVSNVSLRSSYTNFGSDLGDEGNKVDFSNRLHVMNASSYINHFSARGHSVSLASFSKLDSLPWEIQCQKMHDVKEQLTKKEQTCDFMFDNSFMKSLVKFLKDAYDFRDIKAQNESADVLLAILNKSRTELHPFDEHTIHMLAFLLDSDIATKALEILEILSCQPFYKTAIVASGVVASVLKVLDAQSSKEIHELSMKILHNLSCNSNTAYHILYLDCIAKLVPFLANQTLSEYCISIMNTLCDLEEGRKAVAETNSCISSIAKLVETGTKQEQETAMDVLLSLCYEYRDTCQHVIGESIVQALFSISNNGNPRAKIFATELLQMLGYGNETEIVSDSSCFSLSTGSDSGNGNRSKGKKSRPKGFGYFGAKIKRFFNPKHKQM